MIDKKLDTYNHVPTLESPMVTRLIVASYVLLLVSVLAWLTSYALLPTPWPLALPLAAFALLVSALAHNYERLRPKHCRFCGCRLTYIIRPLLLTPQYLSMEGRKTGNYFYTQKKRGRLGPNHWVKLSNQSLACHHCRLIEEKYRLVEETPDAGELQQLGDTITPPEN